MSVILLIPLLALCGVFGTRVGDVTATGDGVALEVQFPEVFRYKTIDPLELTIRNNGSGARTLTFHMSRDYISQFSNVRFTPEPDRIDEDAYHFDLGMLAPGESVVISGEIQAENAARTTGRLWLSESAELLAETKITTWSLP